MFKSIPEHPGYLQPGVMQLESNLFSVGRISPFITAILSRSSASLADLNQFALKQDENFAELN